MLIRKVDNYPSLIGKFIFGYRVYKAWMKVQEHLKRQKPSSLAFDPEHPERAYVSEFASADWADC